MALEEDLLALYACPLSEFLERRKALAQSLRKAGKKDDAAAVAGAAKPTPAAWAVNQVARRHPDEMAALMRAGEAVRARLRASFSGQPDAKATAKAQAEQRDAVLALVPLATALLEGSGTSASAAVTERIGTTLSAISTTGKWADAAPSMLTKELDPPGIEALTALVADLSNEPAVALAPPPAKAESAVQETDLPERLAAAEAALQGVIEVEERCRKIVLRAKAALAQLSAKREEAEGLAREARRLATERERAAEEARKRAQEAAAAAHSAEQEVAAVAGSERAARGELLGAEQALAKAERDRAAAEEAAHKARRHGKEKH